LCAGGVPGNPAAAAIVVAQHDISPPLEEQAIVVAQHDISPPLEEQCVHELEGWIPLDEAVDILPCCGCCGLPLLVH
jgi:hypothetical protein